MSYVLHLAVLISLYALLAQSLNVVVGYAGLVSLGHAAFFGVGAYTSVLLTLSGWSFATALVAAMGVAALVSIAVSLPLLRLTGDYVVLCTLGAQMVASGLFQNWTQVTNGPVGIVGIPPPRILGWSAVTSADYVLLTAGAAAFCFAIVWVLARAPFGRALRAMRDDQAAAEALGKDTRMLRVSAFTIGAVLAAVAGALYATYSRFIDPTSFTLGESIFILAMVIIGGAGTFRGPLLGAATLILLPELLSTMEVRETTAAQLQQVAYGLSIVLLMRLRPTGLAGEYGFR